MRSVLSCFVVLLFVTWEAESALMVVPRAEFLKRKGPPIIAVGSGYLMKPRFGTDSLFFPERMSLYSKDVLAAQLQFDHTVVLRGHGSPNAIDLCGINDDAATIKTQVFNPLQAHGLSVKYVISYGCYTGGGFLRDLYALLAPLWAGIQMYGPIGAVVVEPTSFTNLGARIVKPGYEADARGIWKTISLPYAAATFDESSTDPKTVGTAARDEGNYYKNLWNTFISEIDEDLYPPNDGWNMVPASTTLFSTVEDDVASVRALAARTSSDVLKHGLYKVASDYEDRRSFVQSMGDSFRIPCSIESISSANGYNTANAFVEVN